MCGQMDKERLSSLYVLDSRNRPVRTTKEFFEDFMKNSPERRVVAADQLFIDGTKIVISTVFTGIDDNGCFFHTMVMGGEFSESTWKYQTYEQAEVGHRQIVSAYEEHFNLESEPC